jgi:hypothetical protein
MHLHFKMSVNTRIELGNGTLMRQQFFDFLDLVRQQLPRRVRCERISRIGGDRNG